jgi:hypothetical protein
MAGTSARMCLLSSWLSKQTEAAYQLEYPIGDTLAATPRYPFDLIIRLIVLALLGLGLAPLIEKRRAAHEQRRQAGVASVAA